MTTWPTRTQQLGLIIVLALLAVLSLARACASGSSI
jgi:hypothetical protein